MKDLVLLNNINQEIINTVKYIDKSKKNDFVFPLKLENIGTKSLFGMMLNFTNLEVNNCKFTGFFVKEIAKETSMNLQGSIFHNKLLLKNNKFEKKVNFFDLYILGDFILENNIFEEFIDFGDCWFKGNVIIRNNKFNKGTNLLGNLDKAYKVTFDKKPRIENNVGNLEMNKLIK